MAPLGRGPALALFCTALLLAATSRPAHAHGLSPSLLDLREAADGSVEVTWKMPVMRVPGARVEPVLPGGCAAVSVPDVANDGMTITARWRARCRDGLVGQRIGVDGLGVARSDALLRVGLAHGRLFQAVVSGREPTVTVPVQPQRLDVVRDYVRLGIWHILSGPDHLLFVFGLILLVRSRRLLVETITAFTVGHSITLSLAVLGAAQVAQQPVEILIAFSIFVVGVELVREGDGSGLMRRYPWAIALLFGLLHGLGFASALRAAGLPADDIGIGLFSFNLGVEIGQLAFVLAVLAVRSVTLRVRPRRPAWVGQVPGYAVGSLAAFWCYARIAALWQ